MLYHSDITSVNLRNKMIKTCTKLCIVAWFITGKNMEWKQMLMIRMAKLRLLYIGNLIAIKKECIGDICFIHKDILCYWVSKRQDVKKHIIVFYKYCIKE